MLDKLKSKLGSSLAVVKKTDTPQITPDISRVLKSPETSETPAPAAVPPQPMAEQVTQPPLNQPSTTLEMESRAEAAVDSLSDKFDTWMKTDLDKLMAAWIIASAPDATAGDYQKLFMASHDIHGAAVSYGYPAVSRLCGSLGTLLGNTRPGENSALINLHIEACRAAFKAENPADAGEEIANAVCTALEKKVAYYTGT